MALSVFSPSHHDAPHHDPSTPSTAAPSPASTCVSPINIQRHVHGRNLGDVKVHKPAGLRLDATITGAIVQEEALLALNMCCCSVARGGWEIERSLRSKRAGAALRQEIGD